MGLALAIASIVRAGVEIICKHLRRGRRTLFARMGFVVSHPFAKCAKGWGTQI